MHFYIITDPPSDTIRRRAPLYFIYIVEQNSLGVFVFVCVGRDIHSCVSSWVWMAEKNGIRRGNGEVIR